MACKKNENSDTKTSKMSKKILKNQKIHRLKIIETKQNIYVTAQ